MQKSPLFTHNFPVSVTVFGIFQAHPLTFAAKSENPGFLA